MHLSVAFIFFFMFATSEQSLKLAANEHVGFAARVSQLSIRPGSVAHVLVRLTPQEGIHINTDPAMEFEWTRDPFVRFDSVASVPKDDKTGYLDVKSPVKYSFTLLPGIPKGKHTIKGIVRYYYCSDGEGWCNRFIQPVELSFTVTP